MPKSEKEKVMKTVVKSKPKAIPVPVKEPVVEPVPKKPRAKKAPPTKEEVLKLLSEGAIELKQILQDLKDDQSKFSLITMKRVPALVEETIKNLTEDLEDMESEKQALETAQPEE